jgi:hypothetical protein
MVCCVGEGAGESRAVAAVKARSLPISDLVRLIEGGVWRHAFR